MDIMKISDEETKLLDRQRKSGRSDRNFYFGRVSRSLQSRWEAMEGQLSTAKKLMRHIPRFVEQRWQAFV